MCRVFRFYVYCVVIIVSGCRKEKNERHVAWLLIALLVCRNLILYQVLYVCDCFCLVFVWHLSLIFSQYGGAIYNSNSGDLTFEGSATFTSCSAEASSSNSAYAVSGSECLSVEKRQPTTLSSQAKSSDVGGQVVGGTSWKMMDGGLVGKCSKTQRRSSSRLDCTPQKRSNDDHGAAEMGRER